MLRLAKSFNKLLKLLEALRLEVRIPRLNKDLGSGDLKKGSIRGIVRYKDL